MYDHDTTLSRNFRWLQASIRSIWIHSFKRTFFGGVNLIYLPSNAPKHSNDDYFIKLINAQIWCDEMRCDKIQIEKWIWLERLVIESYQSKCIILFIIWKANDRSFVRLLVLSVERPFPRRSVIDWLTAKCSPWLKNTKVVRLNLERRKRKFRCFLSSYPFYGMSCPCRFCIVHFQYLVWFGSNVLYVLACLRRCSFINSF